MQESRFFSSRLYSTVFCFSQKRENDNINNNDYNNDSNNNSSNDNNNNTIVIVLVLVYEFSYQLVNLKWSSANVSWNSPIQSLCKLQ